VSTDLKNICERAMEAGMAMDLSDCPYGETTGPCAFISRPTNYYYFLAGFVRVKRLSRILEIGTNSGGSIFSIYKGIHKKDIPSSKLLTVDIVLKNDEGFKKYPHIERIKGDSLSMDIVEKISASFKEKIDLIYIDSLHEYEHTKKNIDIYANKLDPRYVILDDIRQNDGMRKLWSELKEKFKDNAFDASDISVRKGAGFGVILYRP